MMSESCWKWIDSLQFSSLFWPPPQDEQLRQAQIMAYVEYFTHFTTEEFPEDIALLIQSHYPCNEKRLLDDVLAIFVLHHPEHGHAIIHPILSCIIDGTLVYDKNNSPFNSLVSLISRATEKEYFEPWAFACGEILRLLTHYNRPIYKFENKGELERSRSGHHATTSESSEGCSCHSPDLKPFRPLTPWIIDILIASPLIIRSDYFRWCGGVMGKYAAAGELKPPTTACNRRSGRHRQLMPSSPRWAVANGAGVILNVCDEEVARYETVNLTATAVPVLLLPPRTTPFDEHLVVGLPALEPYARLFHRYYSIASPSATHRLLLSLLEAPPSWVPDALDAAVQLVELLRAAEDNASGIKLPPNWMHLHFLRAIGTAMTMRAGIGSDAAAALLFRIFSQPTLLFPPVSHTKGVNVTIEETAQGIASLLCAHGPDVERRICTILEAAYGLLPLSSFTVDLPEIVMAAPLQPPSLSWSLFLPLLRVLEYLPQGSPSEACLMRIFMANVEALLRRTFLQDASIEQSKRLRNNGGMWSNTNNLAVSELRPMIHSLFLESCASKELASRLLFVVLTVCISHGALPNRSIAHSSIGVTGEIEALDCKKTGKRSPIKQDPAATFNSYIVATICALACELQLFPLISKSGFHPNSKDPVRLAKAAKTKELSQGACNGLSSAVRRTRRFLGILEALYSLNPSSVGTSLGHSSNELTDATMVATHVSELFRGSTACMNALSVLRRCNWDDEICTRASSIYHLINLHGKTIEPLKAQSELVPSSFLSTSADIGSNQPNKEMGKSREKILKSPIMDWNERFDHTSQALLRKVCSDKQGLYFSVVSLLWHKLIAAPEMQMSAGSTFAQQGWRQVVDALYNVVPASSIKASTVIAIQAERDLQPWIWRGDEQDQHILGTNQPIVMLIVDLMRSLESSETLIVLANASDLLLRTTDEFLVDDETCTLSLLQCQFPPTVRRLSHQNVLARASGISVLRDSMNLDFTMKLGKHVWHDSSS